MRVVKWEEKFAIEVNTKELGNVLLFNSDSNLPIPLLFNTQDEATDFISRTKDKYRNIENH